VRHLASTSPEIGDQMEFEEFRQRLEAARVRRALQRLEAVEGLARNVDINRANGEAFVRDSADRLAKDGHVDVPPDRRLPRH
jgi:hypothetical protein